MQNKLYFIKIKDQRQKLVKIFEIFLLFPPKFAWADAKQTLK
jgi:hypothetical protein